MAGTDLRERLIHVTTEIVATDGVEAVTIREVARRCGVSHGAPRRHFRTRALLLSAVARHGFDDLRAAVGDLTSVETPGQLATTGRAYVRFTVDHPALVELMYRHDLLEGSGGDLRATSLPLLRDWSAAVRVAVPGSTDLDAATLWATVHGIATLAAHESLRLVDLDPEDLVRHAVDQLALNASGRVGP